MPHHTEGTVIYQTYDEHGLIEVVDSGPIRSLHFGTEARQSSMYKFAPRQLCLNYTRAMMAWRLFRETWQYALMIGLGGGSLAKVLLNDFATGKLDVVECRACVVEVAQRYFALPQDEARLNITVGDGGEYVHHAARQTPGRYDLLLIDAYDHAAMSPAVDGVAFYVCCRDILTADGILVVNLWGSDHDPFRHSLQAIGIAFAWRVLLLPVKDRANVIVLAFAASTPLPARRVLREKARALQTQSQLEYLTFLKDLIPLSHELGAPF